MDVMWLSATRIVVVSLLLPALGVSLVSVFVALVYGTLQLQDTVVPLMAKVATLAFLLFLLGGPISAQYIEMFRQSYKLLGDLGSY